MNSKCVRCKRVLGWTVLSVLSDKEKKSDMNAESNVFDSKANTMAQ